MNRAAFEAAREYELDDFQRRALDALDAGQSVLVAAPTGSGKTVVAEYAVELALAAGSKAFYTTPLKALSNQKYGDLVRAHGAARVGLLTGDNAINGDAPIVVMTTEVLRNMIYARSPTLDGLRYVVLDEVHYLQNPYRGAVWEEVIIHLPADVDLVCLSATVSNAEEFAEWIATVRGATQAVIEERRPVELQHLYAVGDRGAERLHLLPTFVGDDGGAPRPNPEAARLDRFARERGRSSGRARSRAGRLYTPRRSELVERLDDESMLPAIYFIFSRAGCDDAVQQLLRAGLRLTDAGERRELRRIADERLVSLSDDDLDALGYDEWIAGFEQGIAAHHAGLVPPMKEAVEHAFAAGLVKVVFATETLSLGINMPARSVVIEKLSKFTGEHHEPLTPGEYTQLAGRAGRRGIDTVGYAIVCWNPFVPFEQVAGLASRRTYALRSSFRPTYNMAVNLVRRCAPDVARHLLNLSFAQFNADRDVVALERQLERSREQLHRQRTLAYGDGSDRGGGAELRDYRRIVAEVDLARREDTVHRTGRLEQLRPGDVVRLPWSGLAVVLRQERGRGMPRALVVTEQQKVLRLDGDDFRGAGPHRLATIELPRPFAPRNHAFLRDVVERLRREKVDRDAPVPTSDRLAALEDELAVHPLATDPALGARLRAAAAADRLEREVARLERRVAGRNESLARTFDRVLGLLEAWGYVEGWSLTDAGRMLASLYTEGDLLLAEALREGVLDGLDAAEVAALVSCIAYERRGADGDVPTPPRHWPSRLVATRARAVDRIWRDLQLAERDARLPETKAPDPGFTEVVHGWVHGRELAELLDDEEMTGGDFVRNVKQVIDLLRQVALVAPDPSTGATARAAADACLRGVVLASSSVGV
jgi:ATP-dependent RNA helicase HelY